MYEISFKRHDLGMVVLEEDIKDKTNVDKNVSICTHCTVHNAHCTVCTVYLSKMNDSG